MSFNYYPPTITNQELDLRKELSNIIHGDSNHPEMIPHGVWVILRKLNRDSNGKPILGWEVDPVTKEPDMVLKSENVTKTGHTYSDHVTKGYIFEFRLSTLSEKHTSPGVVNDKLRAVYLDYNAKPQLHDILIVPETYEDGNIISPIKIQDEYIITQVINQKLDGSRTEFYRCLLEFQR